MPALLEIIPRCNIGQSGSYSKPPNLYVKGGQQISKLTRVERLRAHAETQAELAKRRDSVATTILKLQLQKLEKNERFELKQLMSQMKQVRAEESAKREMLKMGSVTFLPIEIRGARRKSN